MVRVALLDDHPAVLAGLSRLIDDQPGLNVVAAATGPDALARQLHGVLPDVVTVDHAQGFVYCRRMKSRRRPPAVVLYMAETTPELVLAARVAQADALVDKASPVQDLAAAIRRAAAGEAAFPDVPRESYAAAVSRLDDADLPIFAMLLDRESVDSIAETLRTRPGDVAWRAQRIAGRLLAHARAGDRATRPSAAA